MLQGLTAFGRAIRELDHQQAEVVRSLEKALKNSDAIEWSESSLPAVDTCIEKDGFRVHINARQHTYGGSSPKLIIEPIAQGGIIHLREGVIAEKFHQHWSNAIRKHEKKLQRELDYFSINFVGTIEECSEKIDWRAREQRPDKGFDLQIKMNGYSVRFAEELIDPEYLDSPRRYTAQFVHDESEDVTITFTGDIFSKAADLYAQVKTLTGHGVLNSQSLDNLFYRPGSL